MRLLRTLDRFFRPLALLAAVVGLGVALYTERGGIAAYPWRISWPAFIGAVLLFGVGPLVGLCVFRILLNELTGRTPLVVTARVWMRAFVARYVPSGALTMAVRLRARTDLNASSAQVWRATLAFLLARERVPIAAPALLVAGVAVAAVAARGGRAIVVASTVAASAWIATGPAAWVIVAAMTSTPPSLFFVTGAYAFAWLLGFLVPFAPSGLGVREATLIALLGGHVGTAPATLIAVTLRLANTVGDLLAFGAVEAAVALPRTELAAR